MPPIIGQPPAVSSFSLDIWWQGRYITGGMAQPTTGTQKLADLLLAGQGTTLRDYLAQKRVEGLSYERITRDLHADTGGAVSVSMRTVQRWIDDLVEVAS